MDETAFDFMDSITPGCVAMFPSGDSVSQIASPVLGCGFYPMFTAPSNGVSLAMITEHLATNRTCFCFFRIPRDTEEIDSAERAGSKLLEACTGMCGYQRGEGKRGSLSIRCLGPEICRLWLRRSIQSILAL